MLTLLLSALLPAPLLARIVFQEMPAAAPPNSLQPLEPLCPGGQAWCNPPTYPDRAVLRAVKRESHTLRVMLERHVPTTLAPSSNATEEYLGLRMLEDVEFSNICDVETDYITPRAAKNKEGKFRFIVNQPEGAEDYVQMVRVNLCQQAGSTCGDGSLLPTVSSMCKQEFIDHKLVALDGAGEELVVDTFSFPASCVCLVAENLEL